MPDLLLAGHSHVFAMGPPQGYAGDLKVVELECGGVPFQTVMEEWRGDRSEAYWKLTAEMARGKTLLLSWNGNQHHAEFLLAPEPMFDVVLGDEAVEGFIVPKALIEELFRPYFERLPAIVAGFKAANARVVLLGTPAPKPDATFFAPVLRQSEFFRQLAAKRGLVLEKAEVTPGPLRFKLWKIVQEMTAACARQNGAEFIPVPDETLDADGLRREFWERDITHANRAYGDLMLRHVMGRL